MENISLKYRRLYSRLNNGLIPSAIRPLFPLFFLSTFSKVQIVFNNQWIKSRLNKATCEKYFPLITVMGPCGPLTHCYTDKRKGLKEKGTQLFLYLNKCVPFLAFLVTDEGLGYRAKYLFY